ncbi:STXB5 protein, partial [Polypterus senegalus]|nr:STXB5 protein [Polypterus senegalus]
GKQPKDGKKPEPCKPILKVEYKTTRAGDPFMILSGGLSYDTIGRRPCLTVMHGKSTAVLEMDYPIVDFLTLCETPYPNDFQEPYAVVVLLEKDLVVIDLAQNGYPIFENPYPLSIHESPVTCCEYFSDCPVDIIPALYSVGARQKRQGYSKKEWPISGGNWGLGNQCYPEIIITGHADGSVKFWDASAIYKLKTAKVFEKSRNKEDKPSTDIVDEDPFAIQILSWCPESRMLCVAGVSAHVIIYKFSKQEVTTEVVQLLEVRLQYELNDVDSPDVDQIPPLPTPGASSNPQPPAPQSHPSTSSSSSDGLRDNVPCLKVRSTPLKQSAGYQVELVIQLVWVSGEPPQQITSLAVNSSYGLVVFGNSNGLAIVDYLQKTVLLNLGTVELYGSNDPYQRQPRSPRKTRQPSGGMLTVASCMCGLSNLYSESVKKLRSSYLIIYQFLLISAYALAGLCDINEGSTTSEDRCKSPTSGNLNLCRENVIALLHCIFNKHTLTHAVHVSRHMRAVFKPHIRSRIIDQRVILTLLFCVKVFDCMCGSKDTSWHFCGAAKAKLCAKPLSMKGKLSTLHVHVGSTSPCNSEDDQKIPRFIEMVRNKSRNFSKMVVNDLVVTSNHQLFHNGGGKGGKSEHLMKQGIKSLVCIEHRDNSFSRSRSSSVTSIDKESREAITSLQFGETYTRKTDSATAPSLWVGTSLGTVVVIVLNLPPPGEQRLLQPVIVSPSGTLIRLKGAILRMSFLDSTGMLFAPPYESWREPNAPEDKDEKDKQRKRRPASVSPSSSQEICENQYAVICSEKQAKVIALPSQNCIYKHNITETSFVLRADIVQMSNSICLACFCANGHIMTLSLPSLRPLLDVNYLPLTDMRIARTFCFTNNGQALYLVSPTEIQRITYSQETCENLQEMLGELFTPVETPEAPNRGFFKGLFGGGAQSLDREELFGESVAGKASRSLAQHIPGPGGIEGMKGAASGVVGELARARIALDERGQKLGELEERTAAMMASADSFSKHAHDVRSDADHQYFFALFLLCHVSVHCGCFI